MAEFYVLVQALRSRFDVNTEPAEAIEATSRMTVSDRKRFPEAQ